MAVTVTNNPTINIEVAEHNDLSSELNGNIKDYQTFASQLSVASSTSTAADRFGFLGTEGSSDNLKIDINLLRRREQKWLKMLSSPETWNMYFTKQYKKVQSRCRKGIPPSIRPTAWLYLSSAIALKDKDQKGQTKYERLCKKKGEAKWLEDIQKDLDRNFPTHELFGGEFGHIGKNELFNVLKAYSVYNPAVGYCQAQAPIAALLLMNMPAEDAFWCLQTISDQILKGYYAEGMVAIQADGNALFALLKISSPAVHAHMTEQEIEPMLFMQEWFLCAYSRTLPWSSVLRIWDMFMCDGYSVIFKVGLVLLKCTLTKEARKECPTMYETLSKLKELPNRVTNEEFLVKNVISINISDEHIRQERSKQHAKKTNKSI